MPDKTNLTNAAVQESAETVPSRQQAGNPDLKGADKDEHGVPWKNRAEEYKEKYATVSEKLSEYEERLAELDEKIRLTQSEKQEKARLETRVDDLEDSLRILDTDPKYRPYVEKINRSVKQAKEEAREEALNEFYKMQVADWVEDQAAEVGMKVKEFRDAINPYAAKYLDRSPLKRTQLAFKDWQKFTALEKREAELARKEQEGNGFAEGQGRAARETTLEQDLGGNDPVQRALNASRKLGL